MKNTTEKKNSTPTCIRTPRRHTVTKHDAITREQSTNKKPGRQYIPCRHFGFYAQALFECDYAYKRAHTIHIFFVY